MAWKVENGAWYHFLRFLHFHHFHPGTQFISAISGHYITRDRPWLELGLGFGFGCGYRANFKCLAWHLALNVIWQKYLNNTATWNPRKPNGKLWSGLYSNELASKSISKFATKNRLKNILKAAKGFSVLVYSLCDLKGPLLELRWLLNYLYTDRIYIHFGVCSADLYIHMRHASELCTWVGRQQPAAKGFSSVLVFGFSFAPPPAVVQHLPPKSHEKRFASHLVILDG